MKESDEQKMVGEEGLAAATERGEN